MNTYEKKYKEALERAKKLQETCDSTAVVGWCEYIFPELKESEDERIRKEIITYLSTAEDKELIPYESWITWLEKQGDQKPKFRVGDTIKCKYDDRQFTIKSVDLDKGTYTYTQEGCGNNIDYADEEFELVEQKPADKVERKFKVGDFIVNDYCMGKVIELTGDAYLLDTGQGIPFSCEHNAHLWTIADAKDGDVLAESKLDIILMFRGIGNTKWNDVIDYHCYYDCYREDFIVQEGLGYWGDTEDTQLKPATKEQRDQLERAMFDAGYRWNKKELKLEKI